MISSKLSCRLSNLSILKRQKAMDNKQRGKYSSLDNTVHIYISTQELWDKHFYFLVAVCKNGSAKILQDFTVART